VLWVGPFLLIALGAGIFLVIVRRRRAAVNSPAAAPGEAPGKRRAEIAALLDGDPADNANRKPTSAGRSSGKR
jgi:cytochrome c-type biogenesis protein CcmH/NrfF